MERDVQENPSVISHVNIANKEESSSPRKPLPGGGGGGGSCDRLKRDEWSEGAVSSLLEAYESKWVLRNRAKLKGQDWEDVARHVSSRANSTKSPKTQTQCKNKIESMKKRYRSESAAAAGGGGDHASSWPLFSRLDHLMRGTGGVGGGVPPSPYKIPSSPPPPVALTKITAPLVLLESLPAPQPPHPIPAPPPPPPPPPPPCFLTVETVQNSPKSNGDEQIEKEERVLLGGEEAKLSDQVSDDDKNAMAADTDSSTPALYGSKDSRSKPNNNNNNNNNNNRMKKMGDKRKRRRVSSSREDLDFGIAQSIQLLAEAVVRSEQARMETMRDVERMRVEAEARRGEMDLKRTKIIANTQLEIARIFAACTSSGAKPVDSCPGITKNCM